MVLAGPGSGKTSVIVERIAYLIREGGIAPSSILVVTFSKMAALEMKDRFLRAEGLARSDVTFGTFHGVFFGILKAAYGLDARNILSGDEKIRILKGIMEETCEREMQEGDFLEDIIREISLVKGGRICLDHYHSTSCPDEVFHTIFTRYDQTLRSRRKFDFDDMLQCCYELLTRREDILAAWRQKFRYILVDEFQDINPVQYDTIRLLAAPLNNLFIVGDDDQSIYRFRGAHPEIMLGFTRDYPDAESVLLDVNYRCSANILETAVKVVGTNKRRFAKKLHTPNPAGRPVQVRAYANGREENLAVATALSQAAAAGEDLQETAVLFRTNQEAEGLVGALIERGIPFQMRDKLPNLFDHWICRDLLSYMHMAAGSVLRADFIQVMNRPNRYISRDAVAACSRRNADGKMAVDFDLLLAYYQDKDWMEDRIVTLRTQLRILSSLAPFAAINFIRKSIGYEDYLAEYARYRRMNEADLTDVLERIQESARSVASLSSWETSIEAYTEKLRQEAGKQPEHREGVVLATLHAVKGLEYDRVFIMNVNEGVIPYRKAILEEAMEEERRLFYVGMTRARKELTLCLARRQYDRKMEPSRFLLEAGCRGC